MQFSVTVLRPGARSAPKSDSRRLRPRGQAAGGIVPVSVTKFPHDALFKSVFQNPMHAAAELRYVLAPAVVDAIDWDTLELKSGEYVDEALADQHSDLLFSARAGDDEVLVYLLFDHQSTSDPAMPLRLLGYMHRIWSRWHEANPADALPFIVPALLSQVDGGWTSHRRFSEMFAKAGPRVLAQLQPEFEFFVDDLALVSNDELHKRALDALPKVALWLLRDVRTGHQLFASMKAWVPLLDAVFSAPNGRDAVIRLLKYVAHASDELQYEKFRDKLGQLSPSAEALTMTIAKELEARGIAKGRVEGIAEGKVASLLLILESRDVHVPKEVAARLSVITDSDELDRLLRRAVTIETADGLFDA